MNDYTLLHASHAGVFERLGSFGSFLDEVVWHGFLDTLKLVLFLFLTYLLMEFIEHKASEKARTLMAKAGSFGPAIGGIFGAVPQCGFSAAAANLYTARVMSLGTLIAVFLSTSDEMLPIMLAGNIKISSVLLILLYKCVVGIAMGYAIDGAMRLMKVEKEQINIDEICDNDGCRCEDGILKSALHHTLSVSLFIFAVTLVLNSIIFFVGYDTLSGSVFSLPVISHILCALVGLIPNCASSVALTGLAMSGVISVGAMMSGLFAGAGVGILVLFKMNKRVKENIVVVALLVAIGVIFGILADVIGITIA